MNVITKNLAAAAPFFLRKKTQKKMMKTPKNSSLFLSRLSKDVMLPSYMEHHIIALMDKGLS